MAILEVMDETKVITEYYHWGADMPFNFELMSLNKSCGGQCIKDLVYNWIQHTPRGKWANWVVSTDALLNSLVSCIDILPLKLGVDGRLSST